MKNSVFRFLSTVQTIANQTKPMCNNEIRIQIQILFSDSQQTSSIKFQTITIAIVDNMMNTYVNLYAVYVLQLKKSTPLHEKAIHKECDQYHAYKMKVFISRVIESSYRAGFWTGFGIAVW